MTEQKENKNNLTFSDGLNFGCGFWVAGVVFSIGMTILLTILFAMFGSALLAFGS
jgi:hypothetical protein